MVPNPSWQESFDVVVAYDVLEHVTHPHQLIAAAASYLRPGGKLFLHTLNRTWHCRLLYLGIVPSLIRRSPEGLHRHEYNIRPQELTGWVGANRLQLAESPIGIRVPLLQRGVWEMLTRRRLDSPLRFEYTSDLSLGYLVHALR
jgi:2-polyprenyl-6-hydroxyphenyl methylase/3-demethylubiquinone-9 3-methyltransferase